MAPCSKSQSMGASRAPLLPQSAGPTTIRSPNFSAVLPSASHSKIHASSTSKSPAVDLNNIFDLAPSKEEAEAAVSALKRVSLPTVCSQFVGDGTISFSSDQCKSGQVVKSVLSQAQHKVLNALRLLRIDPSVQSMVVSLSSDKAVWNAVMKNEMVQEVRKSYNADTFLKYVGSAAKLSTAQNSDAYPDIVSQILSWIFEITKGAVMCSIEEIIGLVNKLFHANCVAAQMDIVSDLVRSSFMVSILVFFVVILKRIQANFPI